MTTEAEFDPERLLTALSGDVAVLRRRMDELAKSVEAVAARQEAGLDPDLAERLEELAERVAEVSNLQQQAMEAGSGKGPVWDWTKMTAEQAADAWGELVTWIEQVLLPRNPSMLASMPPHRSGIARMGGEWAPCWYRHPDAVDELSALYGVWKAAFTGADASAARVAEWRDRWLPGTRARLAAILADCQRDAHRGKNPPAERSGFDDAGRQALRAYVQDELNRRAAQAQPQP